MVYDFSVASGAGFLQPINYTGGHHIGTNPDVSTFKVGSTIPAKFKIKNAQGQVDQAPLGGVADAR